MKQLFKRLLGRYGYSIKNHNNHISNEFIFKKEFLKNVKNPIIIDVGAHKGETLKKYLTHIPSCTVYSFEPFKDSFSILRKNFKSNPAVHLINKGISNLNGMADLYFNFSSATNSLLQPQKSFPSIDQFTENIGIESIAVTTLDSFANEFDIEFIDILKLDIQGGELKALEGAVNLLKDKSIRLIYTEVEFIEIYKNQPLFHDLCNYLANFDYNLFNIYDLNYIQSGQLAWADAIFLPKS